MLCQDNTPLVDNCPYLHEVSERGKAICCINFNKGPVILCLTFMLNALDH